MVEPAYASLSVEPAYASYGRACLRILNSRVCLRTLWSSDYVPQSQYVIRLKSSLPHLQESLDWERKDLTDRPCVRSRFGRRGQGSNLQSSGHGPDESTNYSTPLSFQARIKLFVLSMIYFEHQMPSPGQSSVLTHPHHMNSE